MPTNTSTDDLIRKYEEALEQTGKIELSQAELKMIFDVQAHRLLGISGVEALQQIRKGQTGNNRNWATLILLSSLFK